MLLNYLSVGQKIREVRKKKHISQEVLAEMIDKSTCYISYIECGIKCMSIETLLLIANALGVTTDYLLSDSLKQHQVIDNMEFAEIMADCTAYECRIILDSAKSIKKVLRESRYMVYQNPKEYFIK